MIELFEGALRENNRKSSKGNQLKWESDGIWYKADYLGYEGLAECVVSRLLKKSSLRESEFVLYDPEEISYKGQIHRGCKSNDFADGWQTITLERLFKSFYGSSLNHDIYTISDHRERIRYLVKQVERATGLNDFGQYICKLFTIDAFFLNEDRHTHNISVLMNGTGGFELCPIYDNGAALMSDTKLEYPMGCDVIDKIKEVHSKTICDSFDEQLELAEELYGQQLHFSFNEKDISHALSGLSAYGNDVIDRVTALLLEQKRKYRYLFK